MWQFLCTDMVYFRRPGHVIIQNNNHRFMYIMNKRTWQLLQEGLHRVVQESTTELQMTVHTNRVDCQILDVAKALLTLHTKD